MTENLQQNAQRKGPFSPLQSGCAFVMLANMLLYLIVVAFTFNLLDPSKLNANYLAKRGFTAKPEPEREEDKAFRRLSEQKRRNQQSAQAEIVDFSKLKPKDNSPAVKLSEVTARNLAASEPAEPEKPNAALTESPRTGRTSTRTARSRQYSVVIYPQAAMRQTYSPIGLFVPRTVTLESYETLPVEMASGIDFPAFSLPEPDPAGAYLYRAPRPVPEASRGGLKISSPALGAESLYTNNAQKAEEPPPRKR
ncbi:MAG: hypothetical protein WC701_06445 [Kiritimatiellales bacterium]|jgi:hypothetical protein